MLYRITLIVLGILSLLLNSSISSFAQTPLIAPDEVDRCVEKAIDYLVTKQREDGAIAILGTRPP